MKLLGFDFSKVGKVKPLFEIFEDGNGYFSAQHISGKWLWIGNNETCLFSEGNRQRFKTLESCQEGVKRFIQDREFKHKGTIKFLPNE